MSTTSFLERLGLLNINAPSLGELQWDKVRVVEAFCSCTSPGTSMKKIKVLGRPDNCPQCGYALRWRARWTAPITSARTADR